MVAGLSLTLFAAVVAIAARSFRVQDVLTWSKLTEEPMTEAAMHFAASRQFTGNFIALYRFRSVSVLRGIVSVGRYQTQTPLSRWDDPFKDRVDKLDRAWQRFPIDRPRAFEPAGLLGRLGFGARTIPAAGVQWKGTQQDITFPLWPVALATAIAPGLWLARVVRTWRRRRGGRCVACGYDMRGLDGRRCPECGMLPVVVDRMATG
jgi:hypothetical protein